MEGSNYEENVRPVRARKKGRKMKRERKKICIIYLFVWLKLLVLYFALFGMYNCIYCSFSRTCKLISMDLNAV